jgi:hypothetical protein
MESVTFIGAVQQVQDVVAGMGIIGDAETPSIQIVVGTGNKSQAIVLTAADALMLSASICEAIVMETVWEA